MSNSYTTFYFELPLPNPEVIEKVETLLVKSDQYHEHEMDPNEAGIKVERLGEELSKVFEEFSDYEELGFEWEISGGRPGEPQNLVVYADEAGNTTHAANLIEWLLPDLDIKGAGFEYACYGDGENSGGAFAAVKVEEGIATDWMNTYSWLQEKLR